MKKLLSALMLFAVSAAAQAPVDRDILFQFSTMKALKVGVFDGEMRYSELKEHGDFGIGTFTAMDGEMVEVDGTVYQVRTDGKVYKPNDTAMAPYATVTFFDCDQLVPLDRLMTYDELKKYIDSVLPTKNSIYAIRIDGTFDEVKARSVPVQKKPYPTLDDVVKQQTVFELTNVTGTAVGFYFPAYMDGVQAPGYHFHFLTQNRDAGGHILDCRIRSAKIELDDTREFHMDLPKGGEFDLKE